MANIYNEEAQELDRPLRARYYQYVREEAVRIVERYLEDVGTGSETLDQIINEEVDSSMTYTRDAMFTVWESDNRDAIFEEGMDVDSSNGIPWEQIGYFALRADIMQIFSAYGFDVSDPPKSRKEIDKELLEKKKRRSAKRS